MTLDTNASELITITFTSMINFQFISLLSVACSGFADKQFKICIPFDRKGMGENNFNSVRNVGTFSQGQRCFKFNKCPLICLIRDSANIINYLCVIVLLSICKCTSIFYFPCI